jgi:hypothetical protein
MIGVRPIMYDFCTIKISLDTSFIDAMGMGTISRSLSSSKVRLRFIVDEMDLFAFLTCLLAVREWLSESERGEVLELCFRSRLDFRESISSCSGAENAIL